MRTGLILIAATMVLATTAVRAEQRAPEDWSTESAREEIRPRFEWLPSGVPESTGVPESAGVPESGGVLVISADDREGLAGAWVKEVPVSGGQWVRFEVQKRTTGMKLPRRSSIARILWLDGKGNAVLRPEATYSSYRPGERPRAEPEFPSIESQSGQWFMHSGTYHVPPDAKIARIELHFRWGEPGSAVFWTLPKLGEVQPPAARRVRLATIHYQPRDGKTSQEKCELFAPLIKEASRRQADLVVLPETLTYYASQRSFAEVAEPIPGPSTNYFGRLAKQHDLYIVAGLVERDQHLIYNVAVLIGPDGNVVGTYRKTTLPRGEIERGITPGDEYPVFETRFGKVGMMVCYDGFFPEVARELTHRGAEVIAWPVWGCNPLLASARACENHVYLVSSTYTEADRQWIRSAIYGRDGKMLSAAEQFGTVAVSEVDLSRPLYWHSLGDFQAQIEPHRPFVPQTSP